MLIARVLLHTHTHSHVRACTRLVLHRRPSYESLDALSRRWISRGTLLQQVHRGAALQSAAGADSAARRPCPRSCVLRNAESRRGIRFALWQTRRQRAVLCIVIDGGSSIRIRRIGFVIFRTFFCSRCKLDEGFISRVKEFKYKDVFY